LKQALIVDPQGVVDGFALSALGHYEQTLAGSLQEAEAIASGADFNLVLVAKPELICDDGLWAMLGRIVSCSPDATCVMVHTADSDAAFHARASALGVSVVTAPAGIALQALIGEASAG